MISSQPITLGYYFDITAYATIVVSHCDIHVPVSLSNAVSVAVVAVVVVVVVPVVVVVDLNTKRKNVMQNL